MNIKKIQISNRFALAAGLLFMTVAVLLIYSNTFESPFVFDDNYHILEDPAIRMTNLSWEGLKTAALDGKPRHRWIPNVSWALQYYFHRFDATGYHIVNLLLHLTNCFLLFAFIRYTLRHFGIATGTLEERSPDAVALAATLLWAVHPLHTQSVTYIYQRMTSMAALFFILSLLFYAWGRNRWRTDGHLSPRALLSLAGCVLSGICAIISKENAGMLPIIILLYEWFFFQNLSVNISRQRLFWFSGILLIFLAIALYYLGENPLARILNSYNRRDFTLAERVMTEWRVVVYYTSLFFYPAPTRLNLDHDYPISHILTQPTSTVLSILAISAAVGLAIYKIRENRVAAFCILWFFINLVIESSVIGIEIIYEHRTYLPSMLLPLFVICFFPRNLRFSKVTYASGFFIIIVLSAWSWQRNLIWQNRVTFWEDCAKKSPNDFRPQHDLGEAYYAAGNMESAIYQYKRALELKPNHIATLNNMGNALEATGQTRAAMVFFLKALELNPGYTDARNNIATLLIGLNQYQKALDFLNPIIETSPVAEVHVNAGTALAHLNRLDEAITHFRRALQLQPHSAEAHNNLGVLLIRKNDFQGARSHFLSALRLQPDYASARVNLLKLEAILKDS